MLNGKPVMFAIVRDISERLQMEKALHTSEERLALALKATQDAVWDWDLLTNHLHYSPRWFELIGYEENELDADPDLWRRLMHPDDIERADCVVNNALAEKNHLRLKHGCTIRRAIMFQSLPVA